MINWQSLSKVIILNHHCRNLSEIRVCFGCQGQYTTRTNQRDISISRS